MIEEHYYKRQNYLIELEKKVKEQELIISLLNRGIKKIALMLNIICTKLKINKLNAILSKIQNYLELLSKISNMRLDKETIKEIKEMLDA